MAHNIDISPLNGGLHSVKGKIVDALGATQHLETNQHSNVLVFKQPYTVCKHMGMARSSETLLKTNKQTNKKPIPTGGGPELAYRLWFVQLC